MSPRRLETAAAARTASALGVAHRLVNLGDTDRFDPQFANRKQPRWRSFPMAHASRSRGATGEREQ